MKLIVKFTLSFRSISLQNKKNTTLTKLNPRDHELYGSILIKVIDVYICEDDKKRFSAKVKKCELARFHFFEFAFSHSVLPIHISLSWQFLFLRSLNLTKAMSDRKSTLTKFPTLQKRTLSKV